MGEKYLFGMALSQRSRRVDGSRDELKFVVCRFWTRWENLVVKSSRDSVVMVYLMFASSENQTSADACVLVAGRMADSRKRRMDVPWELMSAPLKISCCSLDSFVRRRL